MEREEIYVTQASMPSYDEFTEAVRPLWSSRMITNMGCFHEELEKRLREYLEVPEVSLMVNGHMSLEMAIQMMGFPEGAEVITTPFTFISTTHAIVRNRLKPVFCDIKPSDGTIDETKIEDLITERTVAILPVHVYGNVCSVHIIQQIADKYGLKVIYDAAHAFGVRYKGKGIGNYGDISIFSFHATKVFNTIEGGAATFQKHDYYDRLYNLKNFGIRDEELVAEVGANAKMNEFCAVMGLCNLRHISDVVSRRKARCMEYRGYLSNVPGIRFFEEDPNVEGNYGYFPVIIEESCSLGRNEIYNLLKRNNIFSRKYFYPLVPDQECYKGQYQRNALQNAEKLAESILVLPLYEEMKPETVERVADIIRAGVSGVKPV